MTVGPASGEFGIWFRRTDLRGVDTLVPARWDAVVPSKLCTLIANDDGVQVSTIEHLMIQIQHLEFQLLYLLLGPFQIFEVQYYMRKVY